MSIGLTGGIGSGKSTAARVLLDCGAHLVDTDAIARMLTLPGGVAIPALVATFGDSVLTSHGALDRAAMRQQAFDNPAVKAQLEAILHPLIGSETRRQADAAAGRPVVYDVPLLTESAHWRNRVQRVLVIDCDEATQVSRVMARPGWDEAAARRVIAQQASREARRAIADAVILNVGLELDAFEAEVRAVWQRWTGAAGAA